MKRLLTPLCLLILLTGCDRLGAGLPPSPLPLPNDGNTTSTTASVTGFVRQMTVDGAMPVEGAMVELLQNNIFIDKNGHKAGRPADMAVVTSTSTDADGWYQFTGVAFGTYVIHVTKAGFVLYDSGEIQVSGDTELDAELKADENGSPSRKRGNGR